MTLRKKSFWILVFSMGWGIFSSLPAGADTVQGRDLVEKGKLITLKGVLTERSGEWYLQTSEGLYAVHLGNYPALYPRGLPIKSNEPAEVHGFAVSNNVAVVWVKTQRDTCKFRSPDGTPLWSGEGQGRNRNPQGTGTQRGK